MLRALAFLGPVVEALAVVEQLRWHARHPDTEPFESFFLAHSGIYLGLALGAVGAAAWARSPRWRVAALLVLGGATVRILALVADAAAHRSGGHVGPSHMAFRVGIGLALAGLAVGAIRLARVRAARPPAPRA